ncbi:MAG: RecX family transcriptional regulator [Bacteroidetes bacterium]|nr:RecX family transcriptional regulator [Bacteroidota bacterium]
MAGYVSRDQALEKMQHFCAYQDRCHQEVRSKLLKIGVYGDDLEEVMADLIAENFLNEERFACSFARGKFRIKHWGKNRIVRELKIRKISDYCIRKALEEISDADYRETLKAILEKKASQIKESNTYIAKKKIAQYAMRKGFESELIWKEINIE